jgi:hypothetical protein
MYPGFSENVLYFYDMAKGHYHRHIGDAEELEHIDKDRHFVMIENVTYQTGVLGKTKSLGSYDRITIDFGIETEVYSHRYTAVYEAKRRRNTKSLFVYVYAKHFTILGKPDVSDLCDIPELLYVYNSDSKIWEDLD